VWVDEKGSVSPLWNELGSYANPRLSPDGKRLALTLLRDGNWDVWVYDLERGVPTRLTFDSAVETEQVWSPDSQFLVYSSDQQGPDSLYRKRADGSGEVERLTTEGRAHWASSWSPDGQYVAYISSEKGFDLVMLPLTGDRKPQTFLSTPFAESSPAFSPDGRWIAYDSNESGRVEVYVRPFPAGSGKWQVSDGGGAYPRWTKNGRELVYRVDSGIMAAPVEATHDSLRVGKPYRVFEGAFRGGMAGLPLAGNSFSDFDVTPDGKRFVMFPASAAGRRGEHPHVTLYTQWFEELGRTFAKKEQ
jgi:Tol biopolymer transport system component